MLDFRLVTEFQTLVRRSFPLVDPGILKATATEPLVIGEWLQLDATGKLMQRGAANPATVLSWPVFAETGRYDTQALGKVPILYANTFEADTKVMAGAFAIGGAVEVANVAYGGGTKRGLVPYTAGLIVGYVIRLPADNNGYLRFIRTVV